VVERGLGFISPSYRACEAGFGAFVEMKRLFSIASEARKGGEVTGLVGCCTGHWLRSHRTCPVANPGAAQLEGCTGVSDGVTPDIG
jgi:hypothetical protein